ncbi:MAG TPA: CCA tRNA nucleotidyltransferase, partial [Mycobacterium sp.]
MPNDPSANAELLTAFLALQPHASLLVELGELFAEAGHELYLVGGSVRDALLDRVAELDLDFTTDARPER